MSKLFIVEGNQTRVLDQKAFDNETLLQDVVERFPKVIALEDLGVTEPFIVIGREVATKAGYIDVLCIESINESGDDFHPRFPGRTPSNAL